VDFRGVAFSVESVILASTRSYAYIYWHSISSRSFYSHALAHIHILAQYLLASTHSLTLYSLALYSYTHTLYIHMHSLSRSLAHTHLPALCLLASIRSAQHSLASTCTASTRSAPTHIYLHVLAHINLLAQYPLTEEISLKIFASPDLMGFKLDDGDSRLRIYIYTHTQIYTYRQLLAR